MSSAVLVTGASGFIGSHIVANLLAKGRNVRAALRAPEDIERVEGKFQLRRGFSIKKDTKVLIVEDVITTGKSILECAKLVKNANAKILGFACIIDRSNKKSLLIKKNKIISQIKISIPVYKKNALPPFLKRIPATKQGSRFLK